MKSSSTFAVLVLIGLLFPIREATAQTTEKKVLTLEGARKVVVAAVAESKQANRDKAATGAIAVVDDGGNIICVERLDNTFAAAPNISIGKARTAALFKIPRSSSRT